MQCLCDKDLDKAGHTSTDSNPRPVDSACSSPSVPYRYRNMTSGDLQRRLLKFHQTRVLNSPCQSVFRQNLELQLDLERKSTRNEPGDSFDLRRSDCEEVPLGKPDTDGNDPIRATESTTSKDENEGDHSVWLNKIRDKRRQLEEYLGAPSSTRVTENSSLRDSYLGPQTNAPSWFRHILENGISLTLLPTSSADGTVDQTSRIQSRTLRLALNTPALIPRFRAFDYSSLALSEPAIFVCEDLLVRNEQLHDSHDDSGSMAMGDKQLRPLLTHSAVVSECRELRVVISGSYTTVHSGCLPFQLVMLACPTGATNTSEVKGTYRRKSLEIFQCFRWKFHFNI